MLEKETKKRTREKLGSKENDTEGRLRGRKVVAAKKQKGFKRRCFYLMKFFCKKVGKKKNFLVFTFLKKGKK